MDGVGTAHLVDFERFGMSSTFSGHGLQAGLPWKHKQTRLLMYLICRNLPLLRRLMCGVCCSPSSSIFKDSGELVKPSSDRKRWRKLPYEYKKR